MLIWTPSVPNVLDQVTAPNQTDVSLPLSQPLNRSPSPVDVSSDSQVVVQSLVESVVQLSQVSAISSVQSPNRVHEDYVYDTMDVFPVFQVSPEIDGYLPGTSPVTPPVSRELPTSPATLGSDTLPPRTTGSLDSLIGGPAMSRSLIEQATVLSRLSPPLISLPDDLLLLPLPVS